MYQPDGDDRARLPAEALRSGSRVAFFGGSFDPPHLGHLAVARAAHSGLGLNFVLFAPVGAQPLKPEGSVSSFADRLEMTRLAIANEPGFALSLADAPRAGGRADSAQGLAPNYTIDTLERLRAQLDTTSQLYCLMGADSFFSLRRWHRATEIPFAASLIVASRPGEPLDQMQHALPDGLTLESAPDAGASASDVAIRSFVVSNAAGMRAPFYALPGLHVEISASQIRAVLHGGQEDAAPLRALLPDAVATYVWSHHLYH
jgi:nicotinate-nucleotide adenylyltransferase